MDLDVSISACIDQELSGIRDAVDQSEGAILQLQSIVGKNMARFVAQDVLSRAGRFPDSASTDVRYQILLARLYAWIKAAT